MSSIKSFAAFAILLCQLTSFISPIPMPAQGAVQAGASGPLLDSNGFNQLVNDPQQQQQQQQSSLSQSQQQLQLPNYNLLRNIIKDRYYQTQMDDPRLNFLRDILERLQMAENQDRNLNLVQPPPSYGYDYEADLNDFLGQPVNKRNWEKFSGAWGKRADNWNKFRGSWGKREQSWNNLKGLWG